MKYFYYKLYSPRDKKKYLHFNGIEASFYVGNYEELRAVENVLENGDRDERKTLMPLLQILQPGDTVYDIGASVGIHTIFMAKKVGKKGRIVAIEPFNKSFKILKQNIGLNNLNNIVPIHIALSDKVERGSLYEKRRFGIGTESLIRSEGSDFCQKVAMIIDLLKSLGFIHIKAHNRGSEIHAICYKR